MIEQTWLGNSTVIYGTFSCLNYPSDAIDSVINVPRNACDKVGITFGSYLECQGLNVTNGKPSREYNLFFKRTLMFEKTRKFR